MSHKANIAQLPSNPEKLRRFTTFHRKKRNGIGSKTIRLIFEASNSEWRQGVSLRLRNKGEMIINNQRIKHAVCWRDTNPEIVELNITTDIPSIEVKNVWDVGNGVMESWHNGAAMIAEDLSNGRRYHCNDGRVNDDFNDIVFRLERVE